MQLRVLFYKCCMRQKELTNKLVMAADMRDNDKVADLIAAGAPLDAQGYTGATPLTEAVWNGHDDVVAQLLKAGADPNIKDNQGRYPLLCAIYSYDTTQRSEMRREAAPGIIQQLLKAGADVTLADGKGKKAIECAIQKGDARVIKVMQDWMIHQKEIDEARRNAPPQVDLTAPLVVRRPLSLRRN